MRSLGFLPNLAYAQVPGAHHVGLRQLQDAPADYARGVQHDALLDDLLAQVDAITG